MSRRIGIVIGAAGLVLAALAPSLHTPPQIHAQSTVAPCGYIDGFDYPVPNVNLERTDFGIYRTRWGGLHTGIDVAFRQTGDPVRAAARGIITYSDIEGWDTEKGVVVIQHTLPDGSLVNTLYGHMEELNGHTFPFEGQCVERGDIIGAVGDPSLSAPHLHYEVRTRYRYEGGPGYTDVNPMELGWLHPVDFTALARVMILPAYLDHLIVTERPTAPPLALPDGSYVFAHSTHLECRAADGTLTWRFDTLGSVTGTLALPDGRALFTTSIEQVLVLNRGNFSALWSMPKDFAGPPLLLGDTIVAVTREHTVMALTPEGRILWETAPLPGTIVRWATSQGRIALATDSNELVVVDATGAVLYRAIYPALPVPEAAPDGFFVLTGSVVLHLDASFALLSVADTGRALSEEAQLLHDSTGNLYVYTGVGRALYAYDAQGTLRWIGYMPGSHTRPPRLGIGGGSRVYALSTDGQLLAYDTLDGSLVAQIALYNGGIDGAASARWLHVTPDDRVTFSSGYLSLVTLDGLQLDTIATG